MVRLVLAALLLLACGGGTSTGGGLGDGGGGTAGSTATGGSGGGGPTCAAVCPSVVAAGCSKGPADQGDCVSGCEAVRSGPCAVEYAALLDCGGAQPQFACDANGSVTVVGCDGANATLNTCLAGQN